MRNRPGLQTTKALAGEPLHDTSPFRETAVLVGVVLPPETPDIVAEHLDELEALTDTMGAEVVDRLVQDRGRVDPSTYIGRGKAEELRDLVAVCEASLIIFDVELSPAQKKNLEKVLPESVQLLDRSAVILEIFARHARTHESKTQVELARLEYLLPRLTSRWTHLHRQRGGIGLRGGEGETQLEVDRRMTQKRIAKLRIELEHIARRREIRSRSRDDIYKVALVGYTNAGKSSLLNALTDAGVLVEDQLFSTLDSTIRSWEPEDGAAMVLIDTVGFIRKLPHQLVASFRSTLKEAEDADLILNVVDVSHDRLVEQMTTTDKVLANMKLHEKPRLIVLNKVDQLGTNGRRDRLRSLHPEAVFVSARSGEGLGELRDAILKRYRAEWREEELVLPSSDGRAVSLVHECLEVLEKAYADGVVKLRVRGRPDELKRVRRLAAEIASPPAD